MRKKTEARRDAIIAIAAEVFLENGFDATSMSEIAARVGGSKATLYNYFSSKEELLLQVLLDHGEKHAKDIFRLLQPHTTNDMATGLLHFGTAYLKLITCEETIAIVRLAVAAGNRSDIGRRFYELGPEAAWATEIVDFFRISIDKGRLRDANPHTMAKHLQGLYSEVLLRGLIAGADPLSDEDAACKAAEIADVFLRAYGPDRHHS
jgi:AcrR family transcriptional regulator